MCSVAFLSHVQLRMCAYQAHVCRAKLLQGDYQYIGMLRMFDKRHPGLHDAIGCPTGCRIAGAVSGADAGVISHESSTGCVRYGAVTAKILQVGGKAGGSAQDKRIIHLRLEKVRSCELQCVMHCSG